MGYGGAEGGFFFGAGFVEMNPLVVFGAVRELVDALLVDCDPGRNADFLAEVRGQIGG